MFDSFSKIYSQAIPKQAVIRRQIIILNAILFWHFLILQAVKKFTKLLLKLLPNQSVLNGKNGQSDSVHL